MTPSLLNNILHHPNLSSMDTSSLSAITLGGAPLVQSLVDRAKLLLPGVTVSQAYGCSEVAGVVSRVKADIDILSLGKPVLHTQVKVNGLFHWYELC